LKQRLAEMPLEHKASIIRALERLVHLYDAWDKKAEATRWRKELDAAKTAAE
jgi:hypothetical protein